LSGGGWSHGPFAAGRLRAAIGALLDGILTILPTLAISHAVFGQGPEDGRQKTVGAVADLIKDLRR
jgi:hypothetical protein